MVGLGSSPRAGARSQRKKKAAPDEVHRGGREGGLAGTPESEGLAVEGDEGDRC